MRSVADAVLYHIDFMHRFVKRPLAATSVLLMILALSYPARSAAQIPSGGEESLKAFLQNCEGQLSSAAERTTRYTVAFVDLRGDGAKEVIVYLVGPRWCGSGGCTSLLLLPVGPSWKIMSKTTVTQLPIRVLSTKTNGWHDLGVWVQGGGIQ